ncbi:MAG: shikimate kinase [Alphaproteobacteria bacterium]|nr:shikimate kinase [Alphaproteobacteria bacterium]
MTRVTVAADAANPDIVARPDRTIVLVGMMGVGKTTIGKRLAQRLGMDFIDADAEIEKAAGCTIPEIFEKFGEAQFRDGERRVIARLLREEPAHVLAAGGGAFNDPETRERIAERGISVWLHADLDVLAKRVARRNNRPLLAGGDIEQKLVALMEQRGPIYALAELDVDTGEGEPEDSVDTLVQKLEDGGYMKVYACRP